MDYKIERQLTAYGELTTGKNQLHFVVRGTKMPEYVKEMIKLDKFVRELYKPVKKDK